MNTKTKVTLFELEEGELFSFGYDPNRTYRLMSFNTENNAVVREQRAGAEDETANPYYDNIIRR